ncbi:NAD dependent epimerase/dehydratase family protein [Roseisalinus antarcticus]|uniref:NAD dependent epimerase/dehydratase family protein n=2 Tax=Roseisalinus antarcticus TaxID=254357 RepID=A0A1Y5TUT2_9RHOB|nr:NAD dependent epimerase/dehydratase family protein [Roseisalinus antarcticus]
MLFRQWAAAPPAGVRLIAQSRREGPGLLAWDPLDPAIPVRADVIFGFAGVVPRDGVDAGLNVDLGVAAVRMAQAAGARRVILASSSAVYGPGASMDEDHPCRPVNAYGAAKLEMERTVVGADVEVCCLRIGNVAWADALLGRMVPGQRVTLDRFADGAGPVRSYIGPRTLAAVLETLAHAPAPLPPVLNLAAPGPVTMEALLRASGAEWGWQPAPGAAVQNVTLDCGRLAALHRFRADASAAGVLIAEGQGLKDPA